METNMKPILDVYGRSDACIPSKPEGRTLRRRALAGKFETATLSVAGLTAAVIGAYIASDPLGFYAGYGLALDGNTDMLSELRATGMNLAILGVLIFLGAFRTGLRSVAGVVGVAVFSAFSVGRIASLALDGWPSQAILWATAVELTIASLCLIVCLRHRSAE